jgi:hypothetical protein
MKSLLSQGTKAVAAAGTPEALVGASTLVSSVEIHARKNTTTANTGNIYVGFTAGAGNQKRVLAPGEVFPITAQPGKKVDLASIYIDAATNADAVTWSALSA